MTPERLAEVRARDAAADIRVRKNDTRFVSFAGMTYADVRRLAETAIFDRRALLEHI